MIIHGLIQFILKTAEIILRPFRKDWQFILFMSILGALVPINYLLGNTGPFTGIAFYNCAFSSCTRSFAIAYIIAWFLQIKYLHCLKYPIIIVFSIITLLIFSAHLLYHINISPTLYSIISSTSLQEIKSYLKTLQWYYVLYFIIGLCLIIGIFFIVDTKVHSIHFKFKHNHVFVVPCAVIIIISFFFGIQKFKEVLISWKFSDYKAFVTWQFDRGFSWFMPRDVYSATALLFQELSFKSRLWESQIINDIHTPATTSYSDNDSINLIFVIGESYQRAHAALYGYTLPTTPNMNREKESGNLIPIHDATTVCPNTIGALSNMLSLNRVSDNESYDDFSFFPLLFHNAGWETFFCDHQYTPTSIFDNELYHLTNNPILTKYCWTAYIDNFQIKYDHLNLNTDWVQIDANTGMSPHRLIIYHLKGQHFYYKDQYPNTQQFTKFTYRDYRNRTEPWLDDKRRQTIAEYDNAVYYNDYIMKRLFDKYRTSTSIIVYVPDHGEEVYDYRNYYGRDMHPDSNFEQWIDCLMRIPLTIWMSDAFINKYPEKYDSIKNAQQRIVSTDDIGHFLLWIGGIQTKPYNPHHNFVSPEYVTPSRKTLDRMPIPPL